MGIFVLDPALYREVRMRRATVIQYTLMPVSMDRVNLQDLELNTGFERWDPRYLVIISFM